MASSGSSAATSTTKSHSPPSATARSTMRTLISRRWSSSERMTFGVKPRFTSLRYRVWSGGSIFSMSWPAPAHLLALLALLRRRAPRA